MAITSPDQTIGVLGRMDPSGMSPEDLRKWEDALQWAVKAKEEEVGELNPDLSWKERLDLLLKRTTS